jgi:tRNA (cytidine/uridine-2'-O-)-methyltransferase
MHIVLYEPDIPQNTGTILRLAACFNCSVHIIEPCGFFLDDPRFKRAIMDYKHLVNLTRYKSWEDFLENKQEGLLLLLTTKATVSHINFTYQPTDHLVLGRESKGAPDHVHSAVDARLKIPMRPEARSINVALSAAIVLGEALRQTGGFKI